MIITDKFVMLSYPKTGSEFATEMLRKLYKKYNRLPRKILHKLSLVYKPSMVELMVPGIEGVSKKSQHGNYRQIPKEHKHKKIVSNIRNPFQRYISHYLYGWWRKHPQLYSKEIEERFHGFPDLSFKEFYEMIALSSKGESNLNIGSETIRFIKFYFKDPQETLANFDDEYIKEKKYINDIPDITFLHQENLNNELYSFLLDIGYPENDIAFIKKAKKINISDRKKNQLQLSDFFSPEMINDVLEKDRLLFDLFPEYDESKSVNKI